MMGRDRIAALFEAQAVAGRAIIDTLSQDQVNKLVLRLSALGAGFSGVALAAKRLADDLPTRRRDADHIIGLARALRDAVADALRPQAVGLDRLDIHG